MRLDIEHLSWQLRSDHDNNKINQIFLNHYDDIVSYQSQEKKNAYFELILFLNYCPFIFIKVDYIKCFKSY